LSYAAPQAASASGTVEATVSDPSGAAVVGVPVKISNKVSGYEKSAMTNESGTVRFTNIPFNKYHLEVNAPGFHPGLEDVEVRSGVPVTLKIGLEIAQGATSVEVHADGADLVESAPIAHTNVDSSLFSKLPQTSTGQGMSDIISMAVPGVVKDSDGFIHPLGDHAETQYTIDNQPVSNQQNKQASNQMPLNAIQSFEAISGAPPPEYGDKASLVITTVTKSGLGVSKPFGSFSANYGSFGTYGENFTLGLGNNRFGNFLVANSARSGRYLDAPEFATLHDRGNSEQIFDRVDYQVSQNDTLHFNLFSARSWFQIPNTYDQQTAGQDQRQQVRTFNIAPGWVHLLGPTTIVNFNPFYREDFVEYFPSRNGFADLPATISQDRKLSNIGLKADISYVKGIHNAKAGVQVVHDILSEHFGLGLTDPAFNAPCLNSAGAPLAGSCPKSGSIANPNFNPGLLPYDLTRGGGLFQFRGHADIKTYGFFAQDQITWHDFGFLIGLRSDIYRGLTRDSGLEPRLGVSYNYKPTSTVIRASFSRFFETPYNENLVLSSFTGSGGLATNTFGAFGATPLTPGRRNQYQTGLQQAIGKYVVVDANYFWKFTTNAFDFDNLFNTPITFPIEWKKSKIDGVSVRVSLADIHGFSAYTVLGHTRARFFGPENGGLIFNSPLATGAFRIDHDQELEQTTNFRYQPKKNGPWASFTWRYDSGAVAGRVPDLAAALSLTGDQQQAIGFYCGNTFATLNSPITSCSGTSYGAKRLTIPAPGKENDDTNPPRIAPRNLFDLGVGTDNLFHTDHVRWTLQLTCSNLTNVSALYNFLSTFSGTHFVSPRAYRAEIGFVF
jgi:hypothetical protein